ncbi:YolD-like family protein [Psychrobacillus sp. MER TA 171]|uniref:YolD-like family protein n=1 Tax=Psychrobacillus sp. MER TA 171 TaxID=2939577 RepID=UPI00203ACEB2|nr:YolD-like family protein [Psychrobacillus sp. MER TA 171]MCM3358049.1 YolD-like family protein [Psychrobacillus sp. MER TA 171]
MGFHDSFFEEIKKSKYPLDPRRNIKWGTSMMLTEHVGMLRDYYEEVKKEPKPELTENDYILLSETIELAFSSYADTKIKRWKDGQFIYNRGTIEEVDIKRRVIQLQDPFYLLAIKMDDIVDVTIMD